MPAAARLNASASEKRFSTTFGPIHWMAKKASTMLGIPASTSRIGLRIRRTRGLRVLGEVGGGREAERHRDHHGDPGHDERSHEEGGEVEVADPRRPPVGIGPQLGEVDVGEELDRVPEQRDDDRDRDDQRRDAGDQEQQAEAPLATEAAAVAREVDLS